MTWKVLDGNEVVANGLANGRSTAFEADQSELSRNIGSFRAQKKHKYVVEVSFLEDASALNITRPCLGVEHPGFSF
jgi:hypothetical protein